MKRVVIVPNRKKDNELKITSSVIDTLTRLGIEVLVSRTEESGVNADGVRFYTDFPEDVELIIVVGGDGSIIDASQLAIRHDIPILGINLGKIGYLTEIDPSEIDILERLGNGEYRIEERMLLEIRGSEDKYAVNDIVVSHQEYLGMGSFKVETSTSGSIAYRADSIIFATPQGSTAYSLSAGGPVVSHDVDTIVMSAVAPHSFFNRSVLFGAHEDIKITNLSTNTLNVSIDGRLFLRLGEKESCTVGKSSKKIKILTFKENSMFSNLFKKMRLLEDLH